MKREKTKDKIIKSTLQIMSKDGVHSITVRKIAVAAKVNIAAINYYFGSKDSLIQESLKSFLETMNTMFSVLDDKSKSPVERLEAFFQQMMEYQMKSPALTRSIFSGLIGKVPDDKHVAEDEKNRFGKFKSIAAEITGIKDDEQVSLKGIVLMSSILQPIMLGSYLKYLAGLDFSKPADRKKYLDYVINTVLKK
ncbi:MAG: TetR family transcriptional regulator [Brevinematales bacterium]|nr:TetR family transcriptional regulator [Brevinematales bacterium]